MAGTKKASTSEAVPKPPKEPLSVDDFHDLLSPEDSTKYSDLWRLYAGVRYIDKAFMTDYVIRHNLLKTAEAQKAHDGRVDWEEYEYQSTKKKPFVLRDLFFIRQYSKAIDNVLEREEDFTLWVEIRERMKKEIVKHREKGGYR